MKQLLLATLLLSSTISPLFATSASKTAQSDNSEVLLSQEYIDNLITELANGDTIKDITALQDITCVEQVGQVIQVVALMRASGLTIAPDKIENFKKIHEKTAALICTLKACTNLNAEITPKMQEAIESLEDLEDVQEAIRVVIEICKKENILPTVLLALAALKESTVSDDIKKAFIERMIKAHPYVDLSNMDTEEPAKS